MSHAWKTLLIIIVILLAGAVAVVADAGDDSWLSAAISTAQSNANSDTQAAQDARSALSQAEAARDKAQQLNDVTALPIAQQAVTLAQQLLDRANRRLTRTLAIVTDLERYERDPGTIDGAAVRLRGSVRIVRNGSSAAADAGAAPVLHEGDEVQTGNGQAEFFYKDGSHVVLDANTTYRVEKSSLSHSIYKLIKGTLHEERRHRTAVMGVLGQIDIHTPTAVVAVRGTSFDLSVDRNEQLHLRPYEGRIEMRARQSGPVPPGGCTTTTFKDATHVICGSSPASKGFVVHARGLTLTTLDVDDDVTVSLANTQPEVVVHRGAIMVDAGTRAPPAKGWWTGE
jgi:hypothetical protein